MDCQVKRTLQSYKICDAIYQSHKSQNVLIPYPTMHHSQQKCAHFCCEWCIVGYGTCALLDLWIGQLTRPRLCWADAWMGQKTKTLLTHWGRVTHIWVSKLTVIGSDNGLSPGWRQAIIWTNAGILLIRTLGTNFSEILSEIHTFSFKKMHLKMSSGKWRPFCLGLYVLIMAWCLFRISSHAKVFLLPAVTHHQQYPIDSLVQNQIW